MFEFTTTVTAEALAARLGRKAEDPEVARVLAVTVEVLTDATAEAHKPIPAPVCDDLVYRVARATWDASNKPTGGPSTQLGGETVVRAPRDPLAPARAILERYVVPF